MVIDVESWVRETRKECVKSEPGNFGKPIYVSPELYEALAEWVYENNKLLGHDLSADVTQGIPMRFRRRPVLVKAGEVSDGRTE